MRSGMLFYAGSTALATKMNLWDTRNLTKGTVRNAASQVGVHQPSDQGQGLFPMGTIVVDLSESPRAYSLQESLSSGVRIPLLPPCLLPSASIYAKSTSLDLAVPSAQQQALFEIFTS